jgi:hypothetical protein
LDVDNTPLSSIVVVEFWINLPVVVSNLATALSVADAGPTTSPPNDGLVFVIVKLGYVPLVDIPVPEFNTTVWSGAVFVTVIEPEVVIGPPDTLIPVLAVKSTLVTVPNGFVAHEVSVPLVVRYLPVLPV